jgi:acyl carrier protein phosphodiesterase
LNYLGHLALAYPDPYLIVGNFIADGLRPAEKALLSDTYTNGVKMHHAIDSFVDEHQAFKDSLLLLKPKLGRYAPVALDIINDYYLARAWSNNEESDYDAFSEDIYKVMKAHISSLPIKTRERVYNLLNYKYLHVYQSIDGLSGVLTRMDKRARFESNFIKAIEVVESHHGQMLDHFEVLYQATKSYISDWLINNK